MLDERKKKILQAIINDYILTAEPVGSRTIARKYNLGVGPATIRNEMADLELLGFIEQLHTSSGRVPSEKGYRFYVDSLLAPMSVSEEDREMLTRWYQAKSLKMEEVFQETARMISHMTHNISLVSAPQLTGCKFKYLQFLPLDEQRVIAVIVTDTGYVDNKIMMIPEGATEEDLRRISESINRRLSGMSIGAIKRSIVEQARDEIIPNEKMVTSAIDTIMDVMTARQKEKVYLGGTTQMLQQPEFRNVDKIQTMLSVLEEESRLNDILQEGAEDGIIVKIGQENKCSDIHNCSVVQATYRIDGEVVGKVAVLGPTRMEYGRIIALLKFMHTHLGNLLKGYRG
ncbi:MAG: heat-inducible transcription repressor HrcA [Selenomonadales bacterium]|jgi:heat-inducible transcriptional repressor|nr:heat-inducible transcription repressor HrcA [Selenomonadales bacterium]MBQ2114071.1 heat-inducible transcription repressor HrcA [Selenomonadales bacterium]MBQ2246470.1 heat-inducible transcription repressor HrcA [Selenomonadales bacterium]MBQ5588182.1 heat-inducible transcription repressor HrcA [Selenomonadales bacterium]MBQ5637110.1 heat-inducible transcription repressor HrcA [Selenomonadales bacterium]